MAAELRETYFSTCLSYCQGAAQSNALIPADGCLLLGVL